MTSLAVLLLLAGGVVEARNNGARGKLPVMGYDTYNAFNDQFDGGITIEQARLMNTTGLVAAGYNTFILDDFYTEINRSASGKLIANKAKFPLGLKHWTNQINKYGVSGSAYSSNGYKTCGGYPAAYGHEMQDLETWREWGWTGMVKYDNCYIPYDNITMENEYGRYKRMSDAIDALAAKYNEEPFIYYLCNWGWQNPQNWAPRIGQTWRIDGDIKPYWSNIANILWLAMDSYLATDFYQHGDLDMLEVGNSNGHGSPAGDLTLAEERTHFTAWAFLKSNLLIGTDLRNISQASLDILLNKEIIAINQDPNEGAPVAPFRIGVQSNFQTIEYNATYPPSYWAGNSTQGPIYMIINTLNETATYSFDITENWAARAGRQYLVRDLWAHNYVGIAQRNWTVTLEAHDVAALLFVDNGPETITSPPCAQPFLYWQCTNPNGTYVHPDSLEWGF